MQPAKERAGVLRFDAFEIDLEGGELRRDGSVVPLQEKPLQFLALLAENAGRPVTREEIRDRLWGPDTFVEFDDSLNHVVKKVREALGDSAVHPRFIKTVPRRGYRFLPPVQSDVSVPAKPNTAGQIRPKERHQRRIFIGVAVVAVVVSGALWRTLRPREPGSEEIHSLLILPFRSLNGGQNQDYLGEGIGEQLTAKLMNLQGLRLVSPEAAYRVSSAGASPAEAGKRLNAEAVLVGSFRTAGQRIRVNAQLIRTADSRILWADGGLEVEVRGLLEAERILAAAIATRLRGALTSRERSTMAHTPTSSAEAYELFLRGRLAMRDRTGEGDLRLAEQLFEQAVRIDPVFPDALAWLALAQAWKFQLGLAGDDVRRASIGNARKALAIDPTVAIARRALISIFHSTGQAEEGLKEAAILRKSRASDAVSLAAIATAYERAGMPDRAVPIFQQALQMDPEDPSIPGRLAFSAYWAGQYELGLRVLEGQLPEVALLPRLNLAAAVGWRGMARSIGLRIMEDWTRIGSVAFSGFILRDTGEGDLVRRILRERLPVYERRTAEFKNERLQIALGLIYSILGDEPRAREQAWLALETNPGDPWTLFFSAEIHAELGHDRQAIDQLRQAIARGFLALHYLDWPHGPLCRLRAHPEVRALRQALTSKIATLRKQY